ncbi:MAG: bifunctional 2-polyprenyl-6-hydroxyphenol methylase/3-demethylubiquinol 3-O-methyltransferase UbiG [Pseudomonadota bacterium]
MNNDEPVRDRDAAGADPAEVAKFEAMAADWWDPDGPAAPLHAMNPCRIGFAVDQVALAHGRDPRRLRALRDLRVVDVGCGGGLACEPLARLGATVTGIDAAEAAITVANAHAEGAGLRIDYRQADAETLVEEGRQFDLVLALEVIEHVPDPAGFTRLLATLAAPGAVVVVSTLNRTARAWATAILGAERIMGWLPRGTHDWNRFVTPEELSGMLAAAGMESVDTRGMVFSPLEGRWRLSDTDTAVNYITAARVPGAPVSGAD